jgi:hypothetical protein
MKAALLCTLLTLVASGRAHGQAAPALAPLAGEDVPDPVALARDHFTTAMSYIEVDEIKPALVELRSSYALDPLPETRYQIGKVLLALGRWVEAEAELVAYLGAAGDAIAAKRSVEVEAMIAEASDHIGLVKFLSDVEGARVFLDTRRIATLPLTQPVRMDEGTHLVEIQADGYETSHKEITVEGGKSKTCKIVLVESRKAEAGEAPPSAGAGTDTRMADVGTGLLVSGSVLLGGGVVLVPIGAALLNSGGDDTSSYHTTGTTLLVTGMVLLCASLPMLVAGGTMSGKGHESAEHSVTLAPFVAGARGSGTVGIAGLF